MIIPLLLTLCAAPAAAQEPAAPPPKKEFARLSGLQQKAVQEDLVALRRAEKPEVRAEVLARIGALGEGIVPFVMEVTPQYLEAGRFDDLQKLLTGTLTDADLNLAWKLLKKKSPEPLRAHLTRRWADSTREDAVAFLTPLLKDESPAVAYEAARGLLRRNDRAGLPIVQEAMRSRWTQEAARLRADFAGLERGPLADLPRESLNSTKLPERLLGLRLFELFGVKEQAKLLLPMLSESDTTLRLAAIDACRVVIGGEPPLEKPSMTQIIEHAELWKKKL
jgi:HEAT repeat protein